MKEFIIKTNLSIDNAEELIRCKDCIFHDNKKKPHNKLYFNMGYCENLDMYATDDGYCSNAIRKDEE